MTHALDPCVSDSDQDFQRYGLHFENRLIYNAFVQNQRDLYDAFSPLERQEQTVLLETFLKTGKYPPVPLPRADGATPEELLTITGPKVVIEDVEYARLGNLLVDMHILPEFEQACTNLASIDSESICEMLSVLMAGAPSMKSSYFNKTAGTPRETKIVAGTVNWFDIPLDGQQRIRWATNKVFVSKSDHSIRVPPEVILFHEMCHAFYSLHHPVQRMIAQNTPSQYFSNHDEQRACEMEGQFLTKMGLVPRPSYWTRIFSTLTVASTTCAFQLQKNDEAFKRVESCDIRGHASYHLYDDELIVIDTDADRWTCDRSELVNTIGMNPGNYGVELTEWAAEATLDDAIQNKDLLVFRLKKNGMPTYRNPSQEKRDRQYPKVQLAGPIPKGWVDKTVSKIKSATTDFVQRKIGGTPIIAQPAVGTTTGRIIPNSAVKVAEAGFVYIKQKTPYTKTTRLHKAPAYQVDAGTIGTRKVEMRYDIARTMVTLSPPSASRASTVTSRSSPDNDNDRGSLSRNTPSPQSDDNSRVMRAGREHSQTSQKERPNEVSSNDALTSPTAAALSVEQDKLENTLFKKSQTMGGRKFRYLTPW